MRSLFSIRSLISFLIAWMITNGWAYMMLGLGLLLKLKYLIRVSSAYLAFLWLPFTPEKIVTAAIALRISKIVK